MIPERDLSMELLHSRKRGLKALKPYLFVMPMAVLALAFVYYPLVKTILYSLSVVNARGEMTSFAGFSNFTYLFGRREFHAALTNTLTLAFINVPVTLVITILLGYLASRPRFFSPIYESMFALPVAVSMSASALLFKTLLNPSAGLINYVFHLNYGWYQDRHTAMAGILLLTVWMGIGLNFLLFLSAFRAVPADLADCAYLDGANEAQVFFHIRLPLISPTILYVSCTNMIQAMMTSGPILVLTQGGPSRATTTLVYLMYTSGYSSSNYSLAACVSLVTFLLTLVITLLLYTFQERRTSYAQ